MGACYKAIFMAEVACLLVARIDLDLIDTKAMIAH